MVYNYKIETNCKILAGGLFLSVWIRIGRKYWLRCSKPSKTKLCLIDRQSVLVNLKTDEPRYCRRPLFSFLVFQPSTSVTYDLPNYFILNSPFHNDFVGFFIFYNWKFLFNLFLSDSGNTFLLKNSIYETI